MGKAGRTLGNQVFSVLRFGFPTGWTRFRTMKYHGIDEIQIYETLHNLQSLNLNPLLVYPALVLCGAKWVLSIVKAGGKKEDTAPEDVAIFHRAAKIFAKTTLLSNREHSENLGDSEGNKFLLLAMYEGIQAVSSGGPISVAKWLNSGDHAKRLAVLSIGIGCHLFSTEKGGKLIFGNVVKAKYAFHTTDGVNITEAVIGLINQYDLARG